MPPILADHPHPHTRIIHDTMDLVDVGFVVESSAISFHLLDRGTPENSAGSSSESDVDTVHELSMMDTWSKKQKRDPIYEPRNSSNKRQSRHQPSHAQLKRRKEAVFVIEHRTKKSPFSSMNVDSNVSDICNSVQPPTVQQKPPPVQQKPPPVQQQPPTVPPPVQQKPPTAQQSVQQKPPTAQQSVQQKPPTAQQSVQQQLPVHQQAPRTVPQQLLSVTPDKTNPPVHTQQENSTATNRAIPMIDLTKTDHQSNEMDKFKALTEGAITKIQTMQQYVLPPQITITTTQQHPTIKDKQPKKTKSHQSTTKQQQTNDDQYRMLNGKITTLACMTEKLVAKVQTDCKTAVNKLATQGNEHRQVLLRHNEAIELANNQLKILSDEADRMAQTASEMHHQIDFTAELQKQVQNLTELIAEMQSHVSNKVAIEMQSHMKIHTSIIAKMHDLNQTKIESVAQTQMKDQSQILHALQQEMQKQAQAINTLQEEAQSHKEQVAMELRWMHPQGTSDRQEMRQEMRQKMQAQVDSEWQEMRQKMQAQVDSEWQEMRQKMQAQVDSEWQEMQAQVDSEWQEMRQKTQAQVDSERKKMRHEMRHEMQAQVASERQKMREQITIDLYEMLQDARVQSTSHLHDIQQEAKVQVTKELHKMRQEMQAQVVSEMQKTRRQPGLVGEPQVMQKQQQVQKSAAVQPSTIATKQIVACGDPPVKRPKQYKGADADPTLTCKGQTLQALADESAHLLQMTSDQMRLVVEDLASRRAFDPADYHTADGLPKSDDDIATMHSVRGVDRKNGIGQQCHAFVFGQMLARHEGDDLVRLARKGGVGERTGDDKYVHKEALKYCRYYRLMLKYPAIICFSRPWCRIRATLGAIEEALEKDDTWIAAAPKNHLLQMLNLYKKD